MELQANDKTVIASIIPKIRTFVAMSIAKNLEEIRRKIGNDKVTLVAVSKTYDAEKIQEAYAAGQREFGENKAREMQLKHAALPADIRWHMIGHIQTNKVKYIAPFVHLIHSLDSERLADEINKQAAKSARIINCLAQMYIAQEETKFGLDNAEWQALRENYLAGKWPNIRIIGLMGMASNTEDRGVVSKEFAMLGEMFRKESADSRWEGQFSTLSMGMSGDFPLAIQEGSNMVRVGSAIFGQRSYD